MSEPAHGIVVAHGDMAAGLVRAVERITGVKDALVAVSNQGLGAEELRAVLGEACRGGRAVVFADLAGGSCGMAGLGLGASAKDVAVVTGVNLPMLVDFVFHRDMQVAEIAQRLAEKGRAGIRFVVCDAPAAGGA